MICSKCREDKLVEAFYTDYGRAKPTPMQYCKTCRAEINKDYRASHEEEIREYQKAYREKMKLLPKFPRVRTEEEKAYQKAYQKQYRLRKNA